MARGNESKEFIKTKLKETFDGAFVAADGKTIRIPLMENGEPIEIKVTLVAAKDIEGGVQPTAGTVPAETNAPAADVFAQPTDDEIKETRDLMSTIGIF